MGLISDIKTLLAGVETSNCYLGDMPDSPDNVICLYESGGHPPDLTLEGGVYENPTFQVRVRNTNYANGISKCEAIKSALNTITNRLIGTTTYLYIRQMSDILALGKDSKNRAEFSINFEVKLSK